MLTRDILLKICPGAHDDLVAAVVDHAEVFAKYGVSNRAEIAHVIAHLATETEGLTRWEEDLYYTHASRLHEVFPHEFPTVESAEPVARNPEALANRVYDGRNGNILPDDGWRYRGRFSGLTGRGKYNAVAVVTKLDLLNHPDLAGAPDTALEVTLGYWRYCNAGPAARRNDIEETTRLYAGSLIGLATRKTYLERALLALPAIVFPSETPDMDTPNTIVPAPAPAATPAKADVTIPHDAFLKLIEGIHMLGAAAQKNAGVDASVPQADAADKAPEVQAPGAPGAPDAPDAASALVSILPKMSNGSQVWMSYAFAGATAAIGIAGFETHQINAQTLATLLGFGGVSVCLHQALAAIHKLIADNFGNGAADMADMVESMVEQAIAKRLGVSQ